jgi:hypothetical protein
MLRRTIVLVTTTVMTSLLVMSPASAQAPVSGAESCGSHGTSSHALFTPSLPGPAPSTHPTKVKIAGDLSSCTGDNAALVIARFSINGRLPAHSDCTTEFSGETSTSHLKNATLKVKWIGVNGENFGTSRARIASVTINDSPYALTIVSVPISAGSFRGETVTVYAKVFNLAEVANECATSAVDDIEFLLVTLDVS